jgi:ATP:ADP antiporter, AAA family
MCMDTGNEHGHTGIGRDETGMVLRCGVCFFFVLFGYFLLRPLREAMGVERSMRDLRWLFVITSAISLVVVLGFGGLVSRLDRRRFIPIAFRAVMACLVVFIVLLEVGLGERAQLIAGYVFYVWLSVINLFMMSVFWAFMADIWTLGQGKRVYASIGVGGTLGALLGSNFVWWLAEEIGPAIQMGIAIVMFELAAVMVRRIDRLVDQKTGNQQQRSTHSTLAISPVGGSWTDGVRALIRSPYLLGIGLYIVFLAVSNTLIYFTQANLVVDARDELSGRIALFAQLDMWTQLATLMVQLFVTAQLIKRLGIGVALMLLPIVTVVGFVSLAWVSNRPGIESWQVFAVFASFNAIHRATRYAVVRPARETLFSVVDNTQKYKAKPIVDVFLYRSGDVAGAGVESAIAAAGIGLMGMAMVTMPLAVLWGGLSIALALGQHRKASGADGQHIEK